MNRDDMIEVAARANAGRQNRSQWGSVDYLIGEAIIDALIAAGAIPDPETTDHTGQLQQRIDDRHQAGYHTVDIDPGDYVISRPLRIPRGMHLTGEGDVRIRKTTETEHDQQYFDFGPFPDTTTAETEAPAASS